VVYQAASRFAPGGHTGQARNDKQERTAYHRTAASADMKDFAGNAQFTGPGIGLASLASPDLYRWSRI